MSGKTMREAALEDRLRNTSVRDVTVDKPDFRELDLGSPVSPLRARNTGGLPTTSSSSGSSGSAVLSSQFPGELSAESSPSAVRRSMPGHTRDVAPGSVNSTPANVAPTGNICPSGRVLKTGMAFRSTKPDILGSGSVNYGHGSIIRRGGGPASKPGPDSGHTNNCSRGLMFGPGILSMNDPEELKRMGNDSYKQGNFAEALTLYDKAISMSPANAVFHFNRAAALMGLKRLPEAVRECEDAIRLDPGYLKAHHRLGSLLLSLGQVENARKHICFSGHQPDTVEFQKLQSVEKHIIRCDDARRIGDWRTVLSEVDAAIASGADASPQLFACRAEALLKLHQMEDAFSALSNIPKPELSTNNPHKFFGMLSEAYVLFVRTQVELSKGRFDSALSDVEKAGQVDPHNIEISTLLNNVKLVCRARARGNDLFKSERFTEACLAYGEGLRLNPSNSVLFCNRAACWYKLGQWEKSVDDCNQALRIEPNYTKALLRRASSNTKLDRWIEAVKDYEVLRRELPDDKEVAESLFHAQVALKKLHFSLG